MKLPLQIKVRNIAHSESFEAVIRERAEKLEAIYDRMTHCRVIIEAPHRHHHQGFLYNVRIQLGVPGAELVVKRESHENLFIAIRDAFEAARRQLQDYVRRRRGDVKTHETIPFARVSKLFSEEGYGFIETTDGREFYFHRNSVLNKGFDFLKIGTEVRFSEEEGEKGPQASSLSIVGKDSIQ